MNGMREMWNGFRDGTDNKTLKNDELWNPGSGLWDIGYRIRNMTSEIWKMSGRTSD